MNIHGEFIILRGQNYNAFCHYYREGKQRKILLVLLTHSCLFLKSVFSGKFPILMGKNSPSKFFSTCYSLGEVKKFCIEHEYSWGIHYPKRTKLQCILSLLQGRKTKENFACSSNSFLLVFEECFQWEISNIDGKE